MKNVSFLNDQDYNMYSRSIFNNFSSTFRAVIFMNNLNSIDVIRSNLYELKIVVTF